MSAGRGAEAAVPASRGSSGLFTNTAGASAALRCVCSLHVHTAVGILQESFAVIMVHTVQSSLNPSAQPPQHLHGPCQ